MADTGDEKMMKYLAIAIVAVLVVAAVGFVAIVASKRITRGLENDPAFKRIIGSSGQQLHDSSLDRNGDHVMDHASMAYNAPKSQVTPKMDTNNDGEPEFDDEMDAFTSKDPDQESKKYSSTWKDGQISDVEMPEKRGQWQDQKYHEDEYGSSVAVDDSAVGSQNPLETGIPASQPSLETGVTVAPKQEILPIKGFDDKTGIEGMTSAWVEPPEKAKDAGEKYRLTRYVGMFNFEEQNNSYCKDPSGKWKWTEYIDYRDADRDGVVEWAMLQCIGTYSEDNNSDGHLEYSVTVALEFQAWDNNSNRKVDVVEGRIGAEEKGDPNSDGRVEYIGLGAWMIELKDDAPNDGNLDFAQATLRVSQTVDLDTDGKIDFQREVYAHIEAKDSNSNSKPEMAMGELDVFQQFSINDDEQYNYVGKLNIIFDMKDPTDDGRADLFTITFWGFEVVDQDLDGNPELGRGIAANLTATDVDSNGIVEKGEVKLAAFAFQDNNSNSVPERVAVVLLNLTAEDVGQGKKQPKYLKIEAFGFIGSDLNEDKNPEVIRAAYICGELTDTDFSGSWDHGRLVVAGYTLDDNNSDGKPESEGIAAAFLEVMDKNNDNHPEHAALQLWGFAYTDPNSDGVHETEHAFVARFEANDTNSDGNIEDAHALIAGWVGDDPDSNGVFEHEGVLIAGMEYTDANSDGAPEYTHEWIVAGEVIDNNNDGHNEVERAFAAERYLYDNNTNGVKELNITRAGYYEMHDNNSDGDANYICIKLGEYRGEDTDEDGTYDTETIRYWEYIWGTP